MENLFSYAAAIRNHTSSLVISKTTSECTSWIDQGIEISKEVSVYYFDNGVVIQRIVEKDNIPCEAVCAECWICYEVISIGSMETEIIPAKKTFENACRESFWLKYHTA